MDTGIVLIGPMCAGKSSTARLLAERLGRQYVELDELRWDYYREIGYAVAGARHGAAGATFASVNSQI